MPTCFKAMYPECRGIIDASEIKVQAPSSLVLNTEMYSSYKSHTTYMGNVVISPSGEIIHISSLFEGSISDKELVSWVIVPAWVPDYGWWRFCDTGSTHTSWLKCSNAIISKQQTTVFQRWTPVEQKKFITIECMLKGPLGESMNFISLIGSSL